MGELQHNPIKGGEDPFFSSENKNGYTHNKASKCNPGAESLTWIEHKMKHSITYKLQA
jgi:hypothetical protein